MEVTLFYPLLFILRYFAQKFFHFSTSSKGLYPVYSTLSTDFSTKSWFQGLQKPIKP